MSKINLSIVFGNFFGCQNIILYNTKREEDICGEVSRSYLFTSRWVLPQLKIGWKSETRWEFGSREGRGERDRQDGQEELLPDWEQRSQGVPGGVPGSVLFCSIMKIFHHYEALNQWERSDEGARPMRAKIDWVAAGTLVLVIIGNGSVAQAVLSRDTKGNFLSVNFG